jgi:hypothetical protein
MESQIRADLLGARSGIQKWANIHMGSYGVILNSNSPRYFISIKII